VGVGGGSRISRWPYLIKGNSKPMSYKRNAKIFKQVRAGGLDYRTPAQEKRDRPRVPANPDVPAWNVAMPKSHP